MSETLPPQTVALLLSYEADTGGLFWLPRDTEWFSHTPDPAKYTKTFNSRFSGKRGEPICNGLVCVRTRAEPLDAPCNYPWPANAVRWRRAPAGPMAGDVVAYRVLA